MSPVFAWPDPEEERQAVERERARRSRVQSYQAVSTEAQARAVAQMAAYYPQMSPGVAVPLGLSGADPNDPTTAQIATAEAKKRKKKRGTWEAIGDFAGGAVGGVASFGADALDEIGGAALDVIKPTAKYGLAAAQGLYELPMAGARTIAAGGNLLAGGVSGAITGASIGGIAGAGIFSLPAAAVGAGIGAVAGVGAGALAEMRGVEVEGEFTNPISQTTLGQDIFGGKSLGEGFLPAGTAAPAQAEAARRAASVGGRAFTPGRFLAASVVDPDTLPYKVISGGVDLANAWKLDPTNIAGGAVASRAARSARFAPELKRAEATARQAAGLVDHGNSPGLVREAVSDWLTHDRKGQGFVRWVTDEKDFETIRRAIPGIAPGTALRLADAATPDEAIMALLPRLDGDVPRGLTLERGLVEKPAVSTARARAKVRFMGNTVARKTFGSRLFAELPGGDLNFLDPTDAVETFSGLQRVADMSHEVVSRNNRALAEALDVGDYRAAINVVAGSFVGGADGVLTKAGAPPVFADKVTRLFLSTLDDLERKAFFEQGLGGRVSSMDIAGETFDLAAPSLISEDIGTVLKIDRADVRAIRRSTSALAPLYNHSVAGPMLKTSTAALDFATSQVWKPFALLRGAYTVRVIAEEQIRMANSGVDSLFAHPLSYLAWMASDTGRVGRHLDRLGVTVRRGDVDVLGQAFTEAPAAAEKALRGHGNEFAAAMGRRAMREHWMDKHVRGTTQKTFRRGQPEHNNALTERIATMHADPVLRRVAHGDLLPGDATTFRSGAQAVRHWVEQGEGGQILRQVGGLSGSRTFDEAMAHYETLVDDVSGRSTAGGPKVNVRGAGPRPDPPRVDYSRAVPGGPPLELPPKPVPPEMVKAPDATTARKEGRQGLSDAENARRTERYRREVADWDAEVSRRREGKARSETSAAASRSQGLPETPGAPTVTYARPATSPSQVVTSAGDQRIRTAIATGELDGVPIYLDNGKINEAFRRKVDGIVEDGQGPFSVTGSAFDDPTLKDHWDKGVEKLFNAFMGNRTTKLSRSPHFRQYYWKEAALLAHTLDAAGQARLLANMDVAELPKAMKDAIRKSAARGTGDLDLEQVDMLLKGRALDATRDLLYDVSKKGNLSDVMRIVWPFAEATKEVMTTWAKLATKNPAIPRRAAQILSGGQGEAGVFYKDEQTGELMFQYPGSRILTEGLLGVPVPLGNRVEGLSMFGSGVLPGFGPTVQLSARWFLPDKPKYDKVRDIVDPFGESASGGVLEQFGPGWLRTMITGINQDDSDAAFGSDMMDIFNAGLSSGRYRNDTPEAIAEGMESAKANARQLFIFRGAAQMLGSPAPPNPEFLAADKDGRWSMMDSLVKEYRQIQDDHPEDANEKFLEKFGPGVFGLVQPSTYAGGKILPDSTRAAGNWARENPGIAKRYPAVYGLFAPTNDESAFDIQVWARQRRTGERIPMDPGQRVKFNNDKLASTIYYNAKERFGPYPNAGQRKFLSGLNDALEVQYPGYHENIGLPEKVDTEQRIKELTRAVEDPDLADSPVVAPIRYYLTARDALNKGAQAAGVAQSVAKAKGTAQARSWLRNFGVTLTREYPAFGETWDRVFEPELVDDSAVPETVSA